MGKNRSCGGREMECAARPAAGELRGRPWRGWLAAVAIIALIAGGCQQSHARERLSADTLLSGIAEQGIADNHWFMPSADAQPPRHEFAGWISFAEVRMKTSPELSDRDVFGQDPGVFPGLEIGFFSHDGELVPLTQNVLQSGLSSTVSSYWDMIVQPGLVWSEPGDDGWSRASFPFALVHPLEGQTHNGLATFLFDGTRVSGLAFQIVQQTSPYYVSDYFVAWGLAETSYRPGGIIDLPARRRAFEAERADRLPVARLDRLAERVGAGALSDLEPELPESELVVSALVYDGTIYRTPCRSAAGGDYPYCDRARFGVWSVTKSAAAAIALLRLAQKYGDTVFEERLTDYVTDLSDHDGWAEVTFLDALNMASGMGHGSTRTEPNDIYDGYMRKGYANWYEADSAAAKLERVFRAPRYPWGPGKVARYRDADVFLLGTAMNAYLRAREGEAADLWDMVAREVLRPIGIHHAPINRTVEPDGARGLPVMAFGYFPSLDDLAKIAQLLYQGGAQGENQILHAGKVGELLAGAADRGLSTGSRMYPRYFMAFWYSRYGSSDGCEVYLPNMIGWGGNVVSLTPGGVTGIRIAKNWDERSTADDASGMHTVADGLVDFCDPPAIK